MYNAEPVGTTMRSVTRAPVSFPEIKKHINDVRKFSSSIWTSKPSIKIDNFILTLHSVITVQILMIGTMFVSMRQYFGEPIDCLTKDSDIKASLIEHYCWIEGAFSVVANGETATSSAYPGVAPTTSASLKRHHKYYQWVYFVLIIQNSFVTSKRPWNRPLPVSGHHNRVVKAPPPSLSNPIPAASMVSPTHVYLPEKKSDIAYETHDKTYSIESSHFPTPIIEHHPNGATVGLDLPEANIRLLLDIDQLGGKPVAQHIGLKVTEKVKSGKQQQHQQKSTGLVDNGLEPIQVNHFNQRPVVAHSSQASVPLHKPYGSVASPTITHETALESGSPASPQLTTIGRSSKIVSIPVSTNYRIGYIRPNDLHSAIHHQIVHGKGGNQVSVLSSPVNYAAHSQHQRFHQQKHLNAASLGGFKIPRLEAGSFKPIENYSNQAGKQFEGQIDIANSTSKKSPIQSSSGKFNLVSPVNVVKGKLQAPISNNLAENEQLNKPIEQVKQSQINEEPINSNDFQESDLQSKLESPPLSSTISNSRNQRSPKKFDKLQEATESPTWNPGTSSVRPLSLVENSNDIVNNSNGINNADQGFDDENDQDIDQEINNNPNESESLGANNNPIRNGPNVIKKSTIISKSSSPTSSSANAQCDLRSSRCPTSCQTITDPLISSDFSLSLEAITTTLGANLLLSAIPEAQTIIQSLIDSSPSGYTLFLPSDEALAKLPGTLINRWKTDLSGLNSLLSNHFIDTQITLENLKTMNGISLKSGSNQLQFGIFRNETYTVNGQQISIGNQRSPNNGIIHIIEGILYPSADKDIMSTLKSCNKFDGFVTLAMGTGLSSILSTGGPYTLFVPSNEALQKIPEKDLQLVRSNMTALKDMLAYHVVPGLYYSNHLMDGQFINSLQSSLPIKVGVRVDRCSRRLVEVNMSPVYGVDIPASNGVIHVIDWIIKPNDNDWCDDVIFPR